MTNALEQIATTIKDNDIVLFMKGTKDMPMCGFSSFVAQVLERMGVSDKVKDVNVLDDEAIRQGVKDYAQWPTIPQLYIKGEFIGGADIVREMFETGELHNTLREAGIPYKDE